ncbi:WD repeat-containing protein 13-like [Cimex lectularius]|uniref:WD repeat-containing protein 55 homolog n=1 Tax=Cimex lectularius TaxID=79782 RepID=A0A8I6TFN7_CIMLE|nr:WD repeat-containing protein 13-like [Cimex lectularius]
MSTAWQQQVFALDARYNAHRAKNHPNFRTLYIRRRNQLLREFGGGKDSALWKQYLRLRGILLQNRYGSSFDQMSLRRLSINTRVSPESTAQLSDVDSFNKEGDLSPCRDKSRAYSGSNLFDNYYSFVNVHHIFDQHSSAVTMVKFANNDRARLCCISNDSTVSICNLLTQPPTLECIMKGHEREVTGCDWSFANDLIVTSSLDGQICVWNTSNYKCIRSVRDSVPTELLSCLFHPVNNNIVVAGNIKGQVEVLNISTGIKLRNNVGGKVLSLAFDSSGNSLWAGNDLGYIMSFYFNVNSGKLNKHKRIFVGVSAAITNINWRAWISREARDPSLLVNIAANMIQLYRVTDKGLQLKRGFIIEHKNQNSHIRSTFCPIMSFRKGACIVTGSEDSCVHFLDIGCESVMNAAVNKLQGHSSPVFGVSFNYDESLLSTSDQQGLVIVWKRDTKSQRE